MLVGLVGAGGFGREVLPILMEELAARGGDHAKARLVFVDEHLASQKIGDTEVVSESAFFADSETDKHFNIAIGSGAARRRIAANFMQRGVSPITIRSADARFYHRNSIARGGIFCAGSIVTSDATIGEFFHCNLNAYVAHDCIIGDYVTFGPGVHCNGNVLIEDDAYIGTSAILRDGKPSKPLRIGKGAVVGMGAVVTKDVPAGETWVGNPARKIETR